MTDSSSCRVRFIDYKKKFREMEGELMPLLREVLAQGDVMLRHQLSDFESNLARLVGVEAAVGVNSCTDALILTLRALGVGPGDEVVTSSHTFVATVAAIVHNRATPVLVDVGEDHAINPAKIEEAVTPRTKVIIPVHLNGYVCRMDEIMQIAERHSLTVVEDSAQALGAKYKGRCGGSWGVAGTFSFYPAKQLGAFGDGGAVTTRDFSLAEKLRLLRNHGRTADGDIAEFSFNSRLDNIQAAILDYKLTKLSSWIEKRRQIAQKYCDLLSDVPQLKLPVSPAQEESRYSTFQNFEFEAQDRDGLLSYLRESGIEIILPWGGKAVHQFPNLELGHFSKQLPVTELLFQHIMTLPMHEELTDGDTDYVVEKVREFYLRKR